jgi:hypothetical protein
MVDGVAAVQSLPPQLAEPQPTAPLAGVTDTPQAVAVDPTAGAKVTKVKRSGRCWKCAINTHATKDFKVVH